MLNSRINVNGNHIDHQQDTEQLITHHQRQGTNPQTLNMVQNNRMNS